MNYPIWELFTIGGPSLIAIISVTHVYVSHLAVGGGIFLWLTDLKGYRENSPQIHEYVHKHLWFFLLLTMVFGGVSGVGIWFIIALVHPAATSTLIHNFVFGWAIEWVFFLGEITALLVYYYKFEQLSRKHRLTVAFLYGLFAWLSLVIITGILAFMLTPGKWLETHSFWQGFFNPTYIPSMLFRSFAAIMIAGLFAYVTTVFLKDGEFRTRMLRYATKWLLFPVVGMIPTGIWYYYSVPAAVRETAFVLNPQTATPISIFIITSIIIFVSGIVLSLRSGLFVQRLLTFLLVAIGLGWMGGFEYSREDARKPYVIHDYMYSTSILKSETGKLNDEGVLRNAKWSEIKKVTSKNQISAGKEIFNIECLSCHTVDGIRNNILDHTNGYTYLGMMAQLTGMGRIHNYMPPFVGTQAEMEALARYITSELNRQEIQQEIEPAQITTTETTVPKFKKYQDQYVLLVWNDLGNHCISDCDPWFVILPPANTLEAHLIKRGETPELITEGIELTYKVEQGYENPSDHVPFWDYAEKTFGVKLEKNIGLKGNGMSGKFVYNEDHQSFIAELIPVVPYKDDGGFNPYPLFTVEARDAETGKLLMSTQVVAPSSTEMGCRNCHGGPWKKEGGGGVSDETAANILTSHDKLSGTNLHEEAINGNPQLCASCHPDPALGAQGKPGHLSLSAAMHGWHANYMPTKGSQACAMCHPAYSKGRTRCYRGIHKAVDITCVDCHGELADHALALLKGEQENRKAARMMATLEPTKVSSKEDINPREPWIKEPDCLNCHVDFEKPEQPISGFNQWNEEFSELYRMRTDNAGIRCEACHGATHANYPVHNAFGKNRDNLQPLQYSGMPYPIGSNMSCEVCHMKKMQDPIHHENMYRKFRNVHTAL